LTFGLFDPIFLVVAARGRARSFVVTFVKNEGFAVCRQRLSLTIVQLNKILRNPGNQEFDHISFPAFLGSLDSCYPGFLTTKYTKYTKTKTGKEQKSRMKTSRDRQYVENSLSE